MLTRLFDHLGNLAGRFDFGERVYLFGLKQCCRRATAVVALGIQLGNVNRVTSGGIVPLTCKFFLPRLVRLGRHDEVVGSDALSRSFLLMGFVLFGLLFCLLELPTVILLAKIVDLERNDTVI